VILVTQLTSAHHCQDSSFYLPSDYFTSRGFSHSQHSVFSVPWDALVPGSVDLCWNRLVPRHIDRRYAIGNGRCFSLFVFSCMCYIKLITLSFWVHVKLFYRIVSYQRLGSERRLYKIAIELVQLLSTIRIFTSTRRWQQEIRSHKLCAVSRDRFFRVRTVGHTMPHRRLRSSCSLTGWNFICLPSPSQPIQLRCVYFLFY